MLGNPYQKYQSSSVMTASPAELTLKLYNGAIKFCNQAVEAIEKKNMPLAHQYNIKAQNIIIELEATLDRGFQYASDMIKLYDFILDLLAQGNIKKDTEKILQAKEFIVEFRDMWLLIMKSR